MTGEERVRRAIEFTRPDRIPLWFWNRDRERSDIRSFELFPYKGGEVERSEWGYEWENLGDGTLGQPKKPVIAAWEEVEEYAFPDPLRPGRFDGAYDFLRETSGRYRAAEMGITGFNTYAFVRGFENALVDFLINEDKACMLLDRIFTFECTVIRKASEHGFHGVHFADDWGTQKDLLISPALWRRLFKPRYQAQFDLVHSLGMHVFFHCCGNITSIVPDFHEIGVDVMNISQPNAVDIEKIGRELRGRQCFMVPVSYQTVSISGSPGQIVEEVQRLYRALGTADGGFIGYIEEYSVMGMSEKNYRTCVSAFSALTA
jgi:uroporphyrinogen decarboxylase